MKRRNVVAATVSSAAATSTGTTLRARVSAGADGCPGQVSRRRRGSEVSVADTRAGSLAFGSRSPLSAYQPAATRSITSGLDWQLGWVAWLASPAALVGLAFNLFGAAASDEAREDGGAAPVSSAIERVGFGRSEDPQPGIGREIGDNRSSSVLTAVRAGVPIGLRGSPSEHPTPVRRRQRCVNP